MTKTGIVLKQPRGVGSDKNRGAESASANHLFVEALRKEDRVYERLTMRIIENEFKCHPLNEIEVHSTRLKDMVASLVGRVVPAEIRHYCGDWKIGTHSPDCNIEWRGQRFKPNENGVGSTLVWNGTLITHYGGQGKSFEDTEYRGIYLPVNSILIPVEIHRTTGSGFKNGGYSASLYVGKAGSAFIGEGDERNATLERIVAEVESHLPLISDKIVNERVPYSMREGKIKRKYVNRPEMTKEQAGQILEKYQKYLPARKPIGGVSLDEYLGTLAIGYMAAFPGLMSLTPREMYDEMADGRSDDMLKLPPRDKKAFEVWLHTRDHSHAFDVVSPLHQNYHAMSFVAPNDVRFKPVPYYSFCLLNALRSEDFVKMAIAFIDAEVPLVVYGLDRALDYLTGEMEYSVNSGGTFNMDYKYSKGNVTKSFKHIEWAPLTIAKIRD